MRRKHGWAGEQGPDEAEPVPGPSKGVKRSLGKEEAATASEEGGGGSGSPFSSPAPRLRSHVKKRAEEERKRRI